MGKGVVKLGEGQWAVKDGNLLAAKETNGRFKNAEFTVTRGSDATYVGRDGLIKRFLTGNETELITNGDFSTSGDVTTSSFDLGWKISTSDNLGVSIVNNQLLLSRPVGENSDYGRAYATTGVNSINVKPANHEGRRYKLEFEIVAKTGTPTLRWYNNGYITFSDTTLGKKTIYFTSTTNRLVVFKQEHEGSTITLDNISLIDVEDIDDTPRIDFTDNTDGHLLLEPQSTNLLPYSEDFSSSNWSHLVSASVDPNVVVSPDGTQNASRLNFHQGSTTSRIEKQIVGQTTGSYTFSVWAKSATNENVQFEMEIGSAGTGTVAKTATSDWQRFEITGSVSSGTVNLYPQIESYTSTNPSIYIWGAQFEKLPYPTSYIPTNGSTVTRDAETCTGAGEAIDFNSEEGVLYAEIAALELTSSGSNYITITDGTYNNRASILFSSGATNQIRFFLRVGGASQVDKNQSVTNVKSFNKVAFKYKANDFAVWINGVEVSTDTSGSVWTSGTINELTFSEIGTASGAFRGKLKALKVYKEALSDTDLQNLTS